MSAKRENAGCILGIDAVGPDADETSALPALTVTPDRLLGQAVPKGEM